MAISRASLRIAKELENLPESAELIEQCCVDGATELRLKFQWSQLHDALQIMYTLPQDYPFKPPDLRIVGHDGSLSRLIKLPCCSGNWSPALQASNVLSQLAERFQASVQAQERIVAELEKLRAEPPLWLQYIGELQVPAWLCEADASIADNSDLDPVCPPGCGHNLRHMSFLIDADKVPPAESSVPLLGPWKLPLVIRAPEGSCYDHPVSRGIRLELTLGLGFPEQAPRLYVHSHMCHLLGASEMPLLFYQSLAEECKDEDRGILASLKHFRRYVSEPLPGLIERGLPHAPNLRGSEAAERWHDIAQNNLKRLEHIGAYSRHRLHADFYEFGPSPEGLGKWLTSGLAEDLVTALENGSARSVVEEVAPDVFAFEMFTESACDRFLAELENYEKVAHDRNWPISRPNSMNNYGLIINEIGLEPWADALQKDVLSPIAAELFPLQGANLTEHHSFLVAYEPGADLGLDMHTDNSDVTFNICLGKEFSGASLVFCGQMGAANHRKLQYLYEHKKGRGVVHLGRQRHGADNIKEGQRRNLIIWNTNPGYRETRNYMEMRPPLYRGFSSEEAPPDKLCVSRTWDRDAVEVLGRDAAGHTLFSSAWCPPPGKEYIESGSKRKAVPS